MKIVGLLAWYDEDPAWLADAVGSALALCDHVVALDGAYALFPDGKPRSSDDQAQAIRDAAAGRHTIVRPPAVWQGNQLEKRTALFRLGRAHAGPDDWFFVFDADDVVERVPADARTRLAATSLDVAVYTLGGDRYHRGLFRALPGLRVEDVHYHYVADRDGRTVHLRGDRDAHELEEFLNLTDLRVRHRERQRPRARLERSRRYDQLIEENGLERLPAVAA